MTISKNKYLLISISAILIYWLYTFIIKTNSSLELPSDFTGIVTSITIVKIVTFFIIYILLTMEGDNFKELGFNSSGLVRQIFVGIIFGITIWVFIHIIFNPVLNMLYPQQSIQLIDMSKYMKDFKSVLVWIPIAIIGGGFVEELQRIFILTRFQKWLGENGLYIALVISSVAFGIGHLYQGLNTAIGTGLVGMMNGLVYLRKRSAIEAISCHAFFDLISIIIGYLLNNS